jgi:peptidoglycan hydrolase CwlO-like protein
MDPVLGDPRAASPAPSRGVKRRPLPNGARAAVVLAAVFVLTASLTLPGRADTGSQLASAQAKLNKLISQIEAATKAKDALQVQLNALAKQMSAMQVQIEQVATQIAQTQHDIDVTLTQIQAQQGVLDQRARLVYEAGPASTLEFLLSSQSMGDLSDRLQIVDAAAASDEDIIQQLQDLENGLNA